jgi:integrase/recombinase XerD
VPGGIRVGGPLGPFRDSVEQALRALEYSEGRVNQLLLLMAHLSRWLDERGLGVSDLTAQAVEQFFVEFSALHRWCRSSRSLAPVLEHLRAIEALPADEVGSEPPSAEEELLASFQHYLRHQRGLSTCFITQLIGRSSSFDGFRSAIEREEVSKLARDQRECTRAVLAICAVTWCTCRCGGEAPVPE